MSYKSTIGILCLISIASGWMTVSLEYSATSESSENWLFEPDSKIFLDVGNQNYIHMFKTIEASNMFPRPEVIDSPNRLGNSLNDSARDLSNSDYEKPFPEIVSVAIVDKVARVTLREDGNVVIHAKEGDVIGSDWLVKEIDLTHVIAVVNGKEKVFNINYKNHTGLDEIKNSQEDL